MAKEVNGWLLLMGPRLSRLPSAPATLSHAESAAAALPPGPGAVELEAMSPLSEVLSMTRTAMVVRRAGVPRVWLRMGQFRTAPQATMLHELSHILFLSSFLPKPSSRVVEEGLCDLLVLAKARPEWLRLWRPWWLRLPRVVRKTQGLWDLSLKMMQAAAFEATEKEVSEEGLLRWETWAQEYLPPPPEPEGAGDDPPLLEAETVRETDLPASLQPKPPRAAFFRGR